MIRDPFAGYDQWKTAYPPEYDRPDEPIEEPPKLETDPYGNLEYAVGSGDDFICFDFACEDGWMKLHAVVNSETGSFIEDFGKAAIVRYQDAVAEAVSMTEAALDWCATNNVRLDLKGWNQDPYYFARKVEETATDSTHKPARRIKHWRQWKPRSAE